MFRPFSLFGFGEQKMFQPVMFVTGATGMVGNCVVRRALSAGFRVRALVRPRTDLQVLKGLPVETVQGDLAEPSSLENLLSGVDVVVHTAAHVGDWGPAEKYRAINVIALEHLLTAARREGRLKRWIQVSSLGVYPARHHYGTDESEIVDLQGLDGYTRTKAEAEVIVNQHIRQHHLPAVIVRPGFIYGRGDRHVVPRLAERMRTGKMRFIGSGNRLLNNTYVGNLVDAIMLSIQREQAVGHTVNIRDGRLVTRKEFIGAIADFLKVAHPRSVPEWIARSLVRPIEGWARLRAADEAPMLTQARVKFMTLNLDFSIEKAQSLLGYDPQVDFQEGVKESLTGLVATNATSKISAAA
tara:strand:+ start:47 stop:1111 length:1065 start_codon:yes stop_codon:yes gene_type:complete